MKLMVQAVEKSEIKRHQSGASPPPFFIWLRHRTKFEYDDLQRLVHQTSLGSTPRVLNAIGSNADIVVEFSDPMSGTLPPCTELAKPLPMWLESPCWHNSWPKRNWAAA